MVGKWRIVRVLTPRIMHHATINGTPNEGSEGRAVSRNVRSPFATAQDPIAPSRRQVSKAQVSGGLRKKGPADRPRTGGQVSLDASGWVQQPPFANTAASDGFHDP
jgi:hypothetical protein